MQLLLVRINIIELSNSILTSNNSIAELFNSFRELSNWIVTSKNAIRALEFNSY